MSAVVRAGQRQFTPRVNSATSDPLVTSDTSAGYRVGDIWVNTTTKVAFELVDATAGAAVWVVLSQEHDPAYIAGNYYGQTFNAAQSTQIVTENVMYFAPVYIRRLVTADRLGWYVFTGSGDAENQTRFGIYRTAAGLPGALVLDAGFVTNGTGTGTKDATINQLLPCGLLWLAAITNRNAGVTGTMPTPTALTSGGFTYGGRWGGVDMNTVPPTSFAATVTPGTWSNYVMPATAPVAVPTTGKSPRIGFRAA